MIGGLKKKVEACSWERTDEVGGRLWKQELAPECNSPTMSRGIALEFRSQLLTQEQRSAGCTA